MGLWHPMVLASGIVQSQALRKVDLLFSPLSNIALLGAQLGVSANRCIVGSNGTSTYPPHSLASASNKRTLLYAGAMGLPNALDPPDVRTLATSCDAGVSNWLPKPLYRYRISPQNVPMSLAAGLQIVSASPDERDCVCTHLLGWWSDAGDTRALKAIAG